MSIDLFLAASDYTDLNQVSKIKGYYCFGRPILPAKLGTIWDSPRLVS